MDILKQSRVTQLHVDEIKFRGLDPSMFEDLDDIRMLSEGHEEGYVMSFLVDIGLLNATSTT